MILFLDKYFNRFFWIVCLIIFIFIVLRAYFIPFSHDEAATFFFYIQSDNYLPYKAHVYTNNHFFNSFLANVCFHIFGSHRFVLRLPNVLSFIFLCIGVFKHFKHLSTIFSKLILVTFFILTINFLDFFELCRGYGLSLAFLVLGFSFLINYFENKKNSFVLLFSLCFQIALASNLILILLLCWLFFVVCIFQLKNKLFFNPKNLLIQFLNLILLLFWIKFSFFYKTQGVLDSGVGDNYWKISFQSLIIWIFGTSYLWVQLLIVLGFLGLIFYSGVGLFRIPQDFFKAKLFYPFTLFVLIFSFYLQKKILHINFPEDRTSLFFYTIYFLSISFLINSFPKIIAVFTSSTLFIATVFYFFYTLNFSFFSSSFYQTIPKNIYDVLYAEYIKSKQIFTIGGHRVRELNYAFLNYRGGSILNHMDDSEQMTMNCDYYFAMKREKPYYQFFYDEIAKDDKWDRVLLKRKEKITRTEINRISNLPKKYTSNQEFFEFLRLDDSTLKSKNCLEAEIQIKFNKVPKPFNSFLVFNIVNLKKENIFYKRIPLNWIADDLNDQIHYFKLTCGKIPNEFGSLIIYLWNIDKNNVSFNLNELKLLELKAKGVNFVIPKSFYPLIEKITQQPLL